MLNLIGIFITSFTITLTGAMMPGPLLTITISESARRGDNGYEDNDPPSLPQYIQVVSELHFSLPVLGQKQAYCTIPCLFEQRKWSLRALSRRYGSAVRGA